MVVFYCQHANGVYQHDFIYWLGNCISEGDISWWIVPGTIDLLEY